MMTKATSSEKQAMRSVTSMTNTLGQTLKQFGGLYNSPLLTPKDKPIKGFEGYTVEQFMEYMGLYRQEGKNGKLLGYTPRMLKDAWHDAMQDKDSGTMYVFRQKKARYVDSEGEAFDVYASVEEAEKVRGEALVRYELVAIPSDRWSVAIIEEGLLQTMHYNEHLDDMLQADITWAETQDVFICRKSRDAEGKIVRTAVEIIKDAVTF